VITSISSHTNLGTNAIKVIEDKNPMIMKR